MDFNYLKDQVSNLSLYDLKAGVRKVQNAVMNFTEMEAKVREATNNEPWGASSSLMQEIASGTFNYQLLNEIMPMIYKRFTEKSAEEWRQIYKALQLLEFLIKHGSERVIDDARSHLSLLKMLKQFHYIDPNGKDQGINVRNRSKELADLLSDVEKIRSERKKAKTTRGKYGGVEGGAGLGGSSSTPGRYGGFGSESAGQGGSYGGFSGGVYGDGGGFGGEEAADDYDAPAASGRRGERFEEYDEYNEDSAPTTSRRKAETTRSVPNRNKKQPEPPKPKQPEVDLFDFGDEPTTTTAAPLASNGNGGFGDFQASNAGGDEDDFDDFQSAPMGAAPAAAPSATSSFSIAPPASMSSLSSSTQFAAPQPQVTSANYTNIFSTTSPVSAKPSSTFAPVSPPAQQKPTGYQPAGPNYYTSFSTAAAAAPQPARGLASPPSTIAFPAASTAAAKKPAGGDAFAALLSGTKLGANKSAGSGLSMQEMAKQKSSAGLWGAPAAATPVPQAQQQQPQQIRSQPRQGGGGALDDLLG